MSPFSPHPCPPLFRPAPWPRMLTSIGFINGFPCLLFNFSDFSGGTNRRQRAEREWGDSIYSLFSSGLVAVLWLYLFVKGPGRRPAPYSHSFQCPVTSSSFCPFRPGGMCFSSLLAALRHFTLPFSLTAYSCLCK